MKDLSFVPSPFAVSPTITRLFLCPVVFILFFPPTASTVVSETISAQTGVSSNAIISAGWYEYFIRNRLTREKYMKQFLLLKDQNLSTLQRFYFAKISYAVS